MQRRLVILGSSLTALAVARDAHAHGLQPLVFDTVRGIAFASRRAQWLLTDDSAALGRLLQIAGRDTALVATGDNWLHFVIAHRRALDAAFAQILHPPNATLACLLDKHAFAQWCRSRALPSPRTWLPGATELALGTAFPLLLRPRCAVRPRLSARVPKAIEVGDADELQRWLERYRAEGVQPVVSQSLLAHRLTQYSVPFARRDGVTLSLVARKVRPPPERCAEGTFVELARNARIECLARQAIERADLHGIGEVEILEAHDNGPCYLVEINARPWLQYALAAASGLDFLGFMLGAGNRATETRRAGAAWLNLRGDRAVVFSPPHGLLRRGQLGIADYLRSLARCNVYAVFDPLDPMPLVHSLLHRRPPA